MKITNRTIIFFAGARSAEETAAIIQDRVKLYLEEED